MFFCCIALILLFYKFQAPQKAQEAQEKSIYLSMSTTEFSPLIIAFSVAVLTLMPHCSSDPVNAQIPVRKYGNSAAHRSQFSLPSSPRKLKLQRVVKSHFAGENIEPRSRREMMEAQSGKREKNVMQKGNGTWREWAAEESPNRSEHFTMDYSWVRRRRPIHNKQVPFAP